MHLADDSNSKVKAGILPATGDGQSDPAYEVIVTDDGSQYTAQTIVQARYPWARWIAGPRRGPAANRNNGAAHSQGEWLAFIDDDCLPDANWLRALNDTITAASLDVVEGRTVCPGKRDDPFQEHVENPSGGVYWSCNLALRRTAFVATTGFYEAFLEAGGEDMEFAWRIKQANLRTQFLPEFLVLHPPRSITWSKLWHRVFMTRWIQLYKLRTKQGPPPGANPLLIVCQIVTTRTLDLLRTTTHLVTKLDRDSWRRQLFYQTLKWITFPLVLPYVLVWEFRFRKQLANR